MKFCFMYSTNKSGGGVTDPVNEKAFYQPNRGPVITERIHENRVEEIYYNANLSQSF